ncbi:MAG: pterin-binding protein [Chloroflexi bacterium RBG_16_48_8]|nr:MAG: pterin-binding protein [Chloroflexi bacterium RBG_16_48_8]
MQTIIRSVSKEVIIELESPFVVIGECINPTGHKKLREALLRNEYDYIRQLAINQVESGADILDINVGVPGLDEVAFLPEVVELVASVVDVPICIDSANPEALAAGLSVAPGKALVNSTNGEEAMLEAVLPIVKEYGAAVIGLTMDDDGIPNDPERRVAVAGKILERAAKLGIPAENVVIDPLVMAVGADSSAGVITLRSIEMIRREFGVNISLGASNVSFGLPERPIINQAFLALAIGAGATCAITNPMKLTATIRAIDLLLGRDPFAGRYISHYRSMQQKLG